MPRSNHPFDAVERYFRTAPVEQLDLGLHIVRRTIKDRKDVEAAKGPATPVKRRTRGPNKPKNPVATTPTPAPAPPARSSPKPAKAPAPVQTGQTVEQAGELVGSQK